MSAANCNLRSIGKCGKITQTGVTWVSDLKLSSAPNSSTCQTVLIEQPPLAASELPESDKSGVKCKDQSTDINLCCITSDFKRSQTNKGVCGVCGGGGLGSLLVACSNCFSLHHAGCVGLGTFSPYQPWFCVMCSQKSESTSLEEISDTHHTHGPREKREDNSKNAPSQTITPEESNENSHSYLDPSIDTSISLLNSGSNLTISTPERPSSSQLSLTSLSSIVAPALRGCTRLGTRNLKRRRPQEEPSFSKKAFYNQVDLLAIKTRRADGSKSADGKRTNGPIAVRLPRNGVDGVESTALDGNNSGSKVSRDPLSNYHDSSVDNMMASAGPSSNLFQVDQMDWLTDGTKLRRDQRPGRIQRKTRKKLTIKKLGSAGAMLRKRGRPTGITRSQPRGSQCQATKTTLVAEKSDIEEKLTTPSSDKAGVSEESITAWPVNSDTNDLDNGQIMSNKIASNSQGSSETVDQRMGSGTLYDTIIHPETSGLDQPDNDREKTQLSVTGDGTEAKTNESNNHQEPSQDKKFNKVSLQELNRKYGGFPIVRRKKGRLQKMSLLLTRVRVSPQTLERVREQLNQRQEGPDETDSEYTDADFEYTSGKQDNTNPDSEAPDVIHGAVAVAHCGYPVRGQVAVVADTQPPMDHAVDAEHPDEVQDPVNAAGVQDAVVANTEVQHVIQNTENTGRTLNTPAGELEIPKAKPNGAHSQRSILKLKFVSYVPRIMDLPRRRQVTKSSSSSEPSVSDPNHPISRGETNSENSVEQDSLPVHTSLCNEDQQQRKKSQEKESVFPCSLCPKVFSSKAAMASHARIHTGKKRNFGTTEIETVESIADFISFTDNIVTTNTRTLVSRPVTLATSEVAPSSVPSKADNYALSTPTISVAKGAFVVGKSSSPKSPATTVTSRLNISSVQSLNASNIVAPPTTSESTESSPIIALPVGTKTAYSVADDRYFTTINTACMVNLPITPSSATITASSVNISTAERNWNSSFVISPFADVNHSSFKSSGIIASCDVEVPETVPSSRKITSAAILSEKTVTNSAASVLLLDTAPVYVETSNTKDLLSANKSSAATEVSFTTRSVPSTTTAFPSSSIAISSTTTDETSTNIAVHTSIDVPITTTCVHSKKSGVPKSTLTSPSTTTTDIDLTITNEQSTSTALPITTTGISFCKTSLPSNFSSGTCACTYVTSATAVSSASKEISSTISVPSAALDVSSTPITLPSTIISLTSTTKYVPPTTTDIPPTATNIPSSTTDVPSTTSDIPPIPTDIKYTTTYMPTTYSDETYTTTDIPPTTTDLPFITTDIPFITTDILSITTDILSSTTTDMLFTLTDVPTSTSDITSTITDVTPMTTDIPPTTTYIPPTTTYIPPTTTYIPPTATEIPFAAPYFPSSTTETVFTTTAPLCTGITVQSSTNSSSTKEVVPNTSNTDFPFGNFTAASMLIALDRALDAVSAVGNSEENPGLTFKDSVDSGRTVGVAGNRENTLNNNNITELCTESVTTSSNCYNIQNMDMFPNGPEVRQQKFGSYEEMEMMPCYSHQSSGVQPFHPFFSIESKPIEVWKKEVPSLFRKCDVPISTQDRVLAEVLIHFKRRTKPNDSLEPHLSQRSNSLNSSVSTTSSSNSSIFTSSFSSSSNSSSSPNTTISSTNITSTNTTSTDTTSTNTTSTDTTSTDTTSTNTTSTDTTSTDSNIVKSGTVRNKGCQCGTFSKLIPGKLTCRSKRCPCLSQGLACLSCGCRGCKNPKNVTAAYEPPFPDTEIPPLSIDAQPIGSETTSFRAEASHLGPKTPSLNVDVSKSDVGDTSRNRCRASVSSEEADGWTVIGDDLADCSLTSTSINSSSASHDSFRTAFDVSLDKRVPICSNKIELSRKNLPGVRSSIEKKSGHPPSEPASSANIQTSALTRTPSSPSTKAPTSPTTRPRSSPSFSLSTTTHSSPPNLPLSSARCVGRIQADLGAANVEELTRKRDKRAVNSLLAEDEMVRVKTNLEELLTDKARTTEDARGGLLYINPGNGVLGGGLVIPDMETIAAISSIQSCLF